MNKSLLSPGKMIAVGFVMVILGAALPFMMVLRMIEPTFFLIFLAYGVSIGGLLLGFVGAAYIFLADRRRQRDRFEDYIHHYTDEQEPKE